MRVKTPTVLQMEAVECGAAALAIILAYLGRWVPLEELRVSCGVSRDGSKASNVVKAARTYGLTAKGFRKEPQSLPEMQMPVIVHWKFNHFLVVEGFSKGKVFLNDPASGPYAVTSEEFDESFTGVVLTFEPTAEFRKGGKKFDVVAALRNRLTGSGSALLFVVLAGLSLVIPGLIVPSFTRIFVDYYLVRELNSWLVPLLVGMAATLLLTAALTWVREYYLLRLETKLAASMSGKFLWHVLRLPMEYYLQRYAGEIGGRVSINDQVAYLLSGRLASTFLDIIAIFFYAILMFIYDPLLTLVGILFAVLNIVALRYVSRKRVDLNQRVLQESGKMTGVAMSGLYTIETLKAIGRESDFFSRWAGYQAKLARARQEMAVYTQYLSIVPPLLTALNTTAILTLGSMKVIEGQLSIGMLIAFQSLMYAFLSPVNKLVELGTTLQDVQGGLKRLDDVLGNKADTALDKKEDWSDLSKRQPRLTGYLELKNLKFGYSRLESPLIEDFNLTLQPGSRVALVGGSGSGKSTVAKLVSGLYQSWEGEILFDGKPRSDIPRSVITNSLAVVDQDIFLFEGSVRDNLTMWDPTIPDQQVIQASKDAGIHNEIAARPGGYASTVAEEGVNFSGGQRQRLEIARALAGNPAVLILDEATSALDPVTESLIDQNLRRRGCTCLIIAHRLSTIRDCDEIIVLERGKIVQRGTHEQMKNVNGPYSRLIATE
ncbi:NHLP family bacteriocin export ABC transporter peptidase/permease/ATPase subunit [Candidatus Chlorohelix sp.]|uniref:NHLP family bacteriocin export ABC transporter peptidase/permease/ATPase subunit n=1 Tax=Candidatus Chlorohelix sp. TaxID=3139201 RepID=UPI003074B2E2